MSDAVSPIRELKQLSQRELSGTESNLKLLFKIHTLTDKDYGKQLNTALELATEHLGMEMGIISKIREEDYEINTSTQRTQV